jgi:hypothetical protein
MFHCRKISLLVCQGENIGAHLLGQINQIIGIFKRIYG